MTIDIKVPSLGESVTEATIARWYKNIGDSVIIDEPLLELETDKVTLEVPAPATGQLSDIKVKDGDTVEVGTILGVINEGAIEIKTEAKAEVVEKKEPVVKQDPITEVPKINTQVNSTPVSNELSPAVRKIVAENNININDITPSGKSGRITKEDALNSLNQKTINVENYSSP
jgi:2-oxoglutarate dehydrogenase E2 component (dihydrolipoamide succinyltransferase)